MVELHPAIPLILGAFVVAVVPHRLGAWVAVGSAVMAGLAVAGLADGTTWSMAFYGYDLTVLRADGLALAFAMVFALAVTLGAVFGFRTMGTLERSAALVYAASAFGVVLAGDLVTLFFFWEVKVVASVLIIWTGGGARSGGAGLRYLLVQMAGGVTLLGGVGWWLAGGNGVAFTEFDLTPASWVILVGLAVSAAVPPLHAWLADAYPESSVAGAVFLSAFTTKAAVYALARGFPGTEVLLYVGVGMALYGVLFAMLQNDIRRLLSYHIVSQVGFMVAAIGLGTTAAVNGATAHAFAHILYKGLLLMAAGAVIYATGHRRLSDLGGLARAMPLLLLVYMVAALSISGVPLFSGFVSKEMVLDALYQEHEQWAYWGLKLASVGTFLSVGLKLPYLTWFNSRGSSPSEAGVQVAGKALRPLPGSMLVAMVAAAAINLAIGVAPGPLLYDLLPFAVDYRPFEFGHVVETFQFLAFVGLGFWLLRDRLGASRKVTLDTDWAYRELPVALRRDGDAVTRALRPSMARWTTLVGRGRRVLKASVRARSWAWVLSETWVLVGLVVAAFSMVLAMGMLT